LTDPAAPSAEPTLSLAQRLAKIEAFEKDLLGQFATMFAADDTLYVTDMFVMGALRRTIAQASGFRRLLSERNFPSAAGLLRMQIDTAMRINALRLVANRDDFCRSLLFENGRFNRSNDARGNRMTDAYLRGRLAEDHPWVSPVYEWCSDYVHLSGRHFYNSVAAMNDDTHTMSLFIGAEDPKRQESDYYEVVESFLGATEIAAGLMLGYLHARGLAAQERREAIGKASQP
jgi:hypothetical protein